MKHLMTVLALAAACLASPAFATTHKGAPDVKAGAGCEAQAMEKKLAGAAKTSFMKKCEADMAGSAGANCESKAMEKKLAGAAKTSFMKKCEADVGGSAGATCDAQAMEKKLAGAAKASFVKKCTADAAKG